MALTFPRTLQVIQPAFVRWRFGFGSVRFAFDDERLRDAPTV
jgi:hypothetical protein